MPLSLLLRIQDSMLLLLLVVASSALLPAVVGSTLPLRLAKVAKAMTPVVSKLHHYLHLLNDLTAYSCKKSGHFARECPDKPSHVGAGCFNCGEDGHNKSDCPNPRKFTGTCRICEVEGHSARECPRKPAEKCRNCNEEGMLNSRCSLRYFVSSH